FPLPQVDLTQAGLDPHLQPAPLGQRRRGLSGAAQRRDVDGVDALGAEPRADQLGLHFTLGRQRRVTVAVHEREHLAVPVRLRLSMPHEHKLDPIRRNLEPTLRVKADPCPVRHKTNTIPARPSAGSAPLQLVRWLACIQAPNMLPDCSATLASPEALRNCRSRLPPRQPLPRNSAARSARSPTAWCSTLTAIRC